MEVTWPAEEAVRSVPGVLKVLPVASRGRAEIDIDFAWGPGMVSATLQAQEALNRYYPRAL
jgi:multidrug efflux pump subunit AcrB